MSYFKIFSEIWISKRRYFMYPVVVNLHALITKRSYFLNFFLFMSKSHWNRMFLLYQILFLVLLWKSDLKMTYFSAKFQFHDSYFRSEIYSRVQLKQKLFQLLKKVKIVKYSNFFEFIYKITKKHLKWCTPN